METASFKLNNNSYENDKGFELGKSGTNFKEFKRTMIRK